MGATNSNPFDEDSSALQNYHFVHKVPELNITYLQHKENSKEYLLREMTYNDQKQFNMNLQKMNRRRGMKNDHLTNLERVEQKLQDRLCSNFYKIYSLWQYPQKNLNNEIMSRMHQKRKFQQKQLWSILASCIIGMSYLQQNEIIHESLTTKTILVDNLGFIKIVDPISVPLVTNFDAIYNNRALKNIYLSPQQCESIQSQRPIPKKNSYKNDVFTMGIILLQCGLLQSQQQCYRHQCQVINWKNLEQNIVRFQKQYNEDLKLMVELMLKRDIRSRLQWIQLEKYVIKDGKKPLHQSSQLNHHQIQNSNINNNKLNYNHNFTLNKFYQQPIPNQNQNNNIITSPHIYNQTQVYQNKPAVINFNYKLPQSKIINYSANTSHQYTSQFYPNRNPISKVQKNQFPSYFPQIQSNKPQNDHLSDNLSNIISNQNTSYINKQVIGGPPLQNIFQNQQTSLIHDKHKPPSQIINYNPYQVPDVYNQTTNKTTFQNNEHFYAQSISNDEIKPIPSKQIYPQALYQTQKTPFLSNYIKNAQSITYDNNLKGNTPSISMKYESKEKDSINTPIGTIKNLDNDTTDKNQLQYVIEHFKQGSRYEGSKLHGMRHGQGKFYYQDGGFYDGNWKQNKMDGYGSLYYQSGKIAYEGEWHNDQFQGLGRLYNENPYPFTLGSFDYTNFDLIDQYWQYYDGEFHQDLKQGQGKLMISNGEFFVGIFEKDMVEGTGKFYNNLGQITEGVWQSNQLLKL